MKSEESSVYKIEKWDKSCRGVLVGDSFDA
jgi:hypothetical protein